ncbi:MAG: hypothetical protein ABIQ95_10385 [Bdellovibrionia bacterium]
MSRFKIRILITCLLTALLLFAWGWQNKTLPPQFTPETHETGAAGSLKKFLKFTEHKSGTEVRVPATNPEVRAEITRKLSILNEILTSKNDNDPRLDTEFKELSAFEKQALQDKYKTIKPENRNERGTLVFLLGRQLDSVEDFDFLKKVVAEAPCTNLLNCNSRPSHPSSHEEGAGEIEVTLEYPQIVALKSLELYLTHHPKTPAITEILKEAINSKNHIASNLALSLNQRFKE